MVHRVSARDVELGEEKVINVSRTAAVVKGGRRFSFTALVVLGDMRGVVGLGQGKAREVPQAIEKAVRAARKDLVRFPLRGDTIPHEVRGRFGASKVVLRPAAPGTGIKAGATVRSVVESLGIRNLLTKAYGSRNPTNLVKAVFDGLNRLGSKKDIFTLRELPVHADREGPKLEPIVLKKREERGDRGGRGRGGPGGGTRGPRGGGRRDNRGGGEDAPQGGGEQQAGGEAPTA